MVTLREMRSVRVTLCRHIRLRRGTTQGKDYDHSSKATRAGVKATHRHTESRS